MILAVGTKVSVAPRTGISEPALIGRATIIGHEKSENKGKVYYAIRFASGKEGVVKRKYVKALDSLRSADEQWWLDGIGNSQQMNSPSQARSTTFVTSTEEVDDRESEETSPTERPADAAQASKRASSEDEEEEEENIRHPAKKLKPVLMDLTLESDQTGASADDHRRMEKKATSPPKPRKVETSDAEDEDDFESEIEGREKAAAKTVKSKPVAAQKTEAMTKPLSPPVSSTASVVSSTQASATSAPSKSVKPSGVSASLSGEIKTIPLPAGVASVIGQHLIDVNRPVNLVSIAQKFKDTYTRAQVEKALVTLVDKKIVETLDDGAKIYWINQSLVEQANRTSGEVTPGQVEGFCNDMTVTIRTLEQSRADAEGRVRALILAPSDDELEKLLLEENKSVEILVARVRECEQLVAEAEKKGQNAATLHANTVADLRAQLLFFRNQWRERKRQLTEFIDKVCDAKGLKNSGKRDLLENMGIETDEEAKVSLLKGTTV